MNIEEFEFVRGFPVGRSPTHVEKTFGVAGEYSQRVERFFVCRGCEGRVFIGDNVVETALGKTVTVVCPGCKKPYLLGPCRELMVAEML